MICELKTVHGHYAGRDDNPPSSGNGLSQLKGASNICSNLLFEMSSADVILRVCDITITEL